MEIPIMLVGLFLLALAIGPILAVSFASKRKQQKLQKLLHRLESEHQLKFSRTDFRDTRAFALDTEKGVLACVQIPSPEKENVELNDLREVRECRFNKMPDANRYASEDEVSELILHFRHLKQPPKAIAFYDPLKDNSMELKGIQLLTREWVEAVNRILKVRALESTGHKQEQQTAPVWKHHRAG